MNFIATLLTPFVALGVMIGSLFIDQPDKNIGASEAIPTTIAFFETTLASAISSTATSFTLTSATDKDGTTLASSTYAFVIDEGSSNEEIVIADCTATACTNALRGVSALTGTSSVSALKNSHRRGASVKITDAPILMILSRILNGIQDVPNTITYDGSETVATTSNDIVYASWVNSNYGDLFNGNTFAGTQYFTGALFGSSTAQFTGTTTHYYGALVGSSGQCSASSPNTQLCDKAYVDSVAVAGASDANETTKGIVEEATVSEINATSSTGGTGAKLFFTPNSFAKSAFASGTVQSIQQVQMSGIPATTSIGLYSNQTLYVAGFCNVIALNSDVTFTMKFGDKIALSYTNDENHSNNNTIAMFPFSYATTTLGATTTVMSVTDNSGGTVTCDTTIFKYSGF